MYLFCRMECLFVRIILGCRRWTRSSVNEPIGAHKELGQITLRTIKVKMGAQLSVFESAYKRLDRELNDPAVDTMQSLQSFLDSCQSFDVRLVRRL